ncbi:hypothetical protein FRZ67_02270 [Panacibacter ginsenosidivorans]|uniref:Uncharacterized protein n=1 Tax=Panacibacter ginsenosidivorans TaxID=1813871 RepID=A0A5B8V3U1_9BACT|nr:hypothetical protein [Panacibacter ginsenosidivorans]QEC66187.1 hypothetical protein FRZ67_02270 [Panacibacter ginsenosidivorans]
MPYLLIVLDDQKIMLSLFMTLAGANLLANYQIAKDSILCVFILVAGSIAAIGLTLRRTLIHRY